MYGAGNHEEVNRKSLIDETSFPIKTLVISALKVKVGFWVCSLKDEIFLKCCIALFKELN